MDKKTNAVVSVLGLLIGVSLLATAIWCSLKDPLTKVDSTSSTPTNEDKSLTEEEEFRYFTDIFLSTPITCYENEENPVDIEYGEETYSSTVTKYRIENGHLFADAKIKNMPDQELVLETYDTGNYEYGLTPCRIRRKVDGSIVYDAAYDIVNYSAELVNTEEDFEKCLEWYNAEWEKKPSTGTTRTATITYSGTDIKYNMEYKDSPNFEIMKITDYYTAESIFTQQ